MYKFLTLILALSLLGCESSQDEMFTVQDAKEALLELVSSETGVFKSLGKSEKPEDMASTIQVDEVRWDIGNFRVDTSLHSYRLEHRYGNPGSGWFENWIWEGRFIKNKDGNWQATPPIFNKIWGK